MDTPSSSVLATHVLGGRAGRFTSMRSEQLFFQYNPNTTVDPTLVNAFGALDVGWTANAVTFDIANDCERLWLVVVRTREVQREVGGPFNPLSRQAISTGPLPAASSSCNNSVVRLSVGVRTSSGSSTFLIDPDREMEFWGSGIDVQLLVPGAAATPSVAFKIGSTTPLTGAGAPSLSGLVVDSLLGCSIIPIEESKSHTTTYFTQQVRSPGGVATVIEVPRAAVAVKIYQTVQGAATALWQRFIGNPATTASVQGAGPIVFAARSSLERDYAVGPETHLQTDVAAAARLFTLIWTIRP